MEVQIKTGVLDRETLESIFQGIREGIIFIDTENRIVYMNNSAKEVVEKIRGVRAEELIGRSVSECHPPKSKDKIFSVMEAVKRGR
jgi:PAS domain S-box-containing protein